nr:unnamed protein product [Digitaria exilis]
MGSTSPSASHDPTNDEEACIHAMELLNGFVASMTVKAAIELGLIDDLLAAGGLAVTPEELVAARPWPRPAEAAAAADRMLRFLASHGVVRCTTEVGPDGKARRSYAAAPVCKWLATRKNVLVDVGGGTGATLQMITARHKHLRGINYDLPHVIAKAPTVEGVEHVGGIMFDYIPSGNAILLKERTEREIADLAAEAG